MIVVTLHLTEYEAKLVRKALQRVQPLLLVSAADGARKAYESVTMLMRRIDAAHNVGKQVQDALRGED